MAGRNPIRRAGTHFIGIGGVGMSGLAQILLAAGEPVTGSDLQESAVIAELRAAGATVCIGHGPDRIGPAARVVYTAAIPRDNAELMEARRLELPTLSRAQLMAEVTAGRSVVAITGTHGKTSTTGMLSAIALAAEVDPSILIGGRWAPIGGNVRIGNGQHFILEACEAYDSFLEISPSIAAITNIEADHLDHYGDLKGVLRGFSQFVDRLPPEGALIAGADCPHTRALARKSGHRVILAGLADCADLRARGLQHTDRGSRFEVYSGDERLGEIELPVLGEHHVRNALVAIAVAQEMELPFTASLQGLGGYSPVERRQETLGEAGGIQVVDDYAHHPTEVRATLTALSLGGRRLVAVFQPHLYSRTRDLMAEFASSFDDAGAVVITDIYPAREAPIPGVTAAALAERIAERHPHLPVEYVADKADVPAALLALARSGDLVVTMGAGDIREAGERYLELIEPEERQG